MAVILRTVALIAISGCAELGAFPTPTPVVFPSLPPSRTSLVALPTATAGSTSSRTDVIIAPEQYGQVIPASIGQTIAVVRPVNIEEWQVQYNNAVLAILTPPERVNSPGPEGWLFKAVAPGRSDIVLTSAVYPCKDTTPCPPPMPARFMVTISVHE
ncbi:MAG: hypothetical protein HYX94_07285 [Chloroflexi bacterium]|nr:hypothetical protein [Chloroflexota bacterium]